SGRLRIGSRTWHIACTCWRSILSGAGMRQSTAVARSGLRAMAHHGLRELTQRAPAEPGADGWKQRVLTVGELMTRNVASVRAHASLSLAARLMWDRDCGSIPVIDSASERVVGMLTDRDLCMAAWSRDKRPSGIRASEAMSKELYGCRPDDTLAAAES